MNFDGKYTGFDSIGAQLVFRTLSSDRPFDVMTLPEDVDAHAIAAALNNACNAVLGLVRLFSNFRF